MNITQLDKNSILEGSVKSLPDVVEGKAEELKDAMVRPSENIVAATNKAIGQIETALSDCLLKSDIKANLDGMADDAAHVVLSRKATKTAIDSAIGDKASLVLVNKKHVPELEFDKDPQGQLDALRNKIIYDKTSKDTMVNWGKHSGINIGDNVPTLEVVLYPNKLYKFTLTNDIAFGSFGYTSSGVSSCLLYGGTRQTIADGDKIKIIPVQIIYVLERYGMDQLRFKAVNKKIGDAASKSITSPDDEFVLIKIEEVK